MSKEDTDELKEDGEKSVLKNPTTKKVAAAAIFSAVGLFLSFINPFAYFYIYGTKINPFAHFINAITGVLIGIIFSIITATTIAILRYSIGIGSIHAFWGGISGAIVVGLVAYILRKKQPKYVEFAALAEPIGTVFIGGTIGYLVQPIITDPLIIGLATYWWLFFIPSIIGSIMGFLILLLLKKARITWKDFF